MIPGALVGLRIALGPVLLWDALDGTASRWFVPVFLAAFLSDVFDGIIARRLGVSTSRLRYADTCADIVLYVAVLASAWLTHRVALLGLGWPFALLLGSTVASWLVDLLKYGRLSSYHPWSAKAWGITLAVAVVALFGWNYTGWAMGLMIGVGVLSNLECLAMTLALPRWTHDVKSLIHARRLRTTLLH